MPKSKSFSLFFALFIYSTVSLAEGFPIDFSTNGFKGKWKVSTESTRESNDRTITLEPGDYTVEIANKGTFGIRVHENGLVQPTNNSLAAIGGIQLLTFQTTTVKIDNGGYAGSWSVIEVHTEDRSQSPTTDVVLVRNLDYQMAVASPGQFHFRLGGNNGDIVKVIDNSRAATGGRGFLNFSVVDIGFSSGNAEDGYFWGEWSISRVVAAAPKPEDPNDLSTYPCTQTHRCHITLVRHVDYEIVVAGTGRFIIQLDENDNVTVRDGVSGIGGYRTLDFDVIDFTIETGPNPEYTYIGWWYLGRVHVQEEPVYSRTVKLVRGVSYSMHLGWGYFYFALDEEDNSVIANGVSAIPKHKALEFVVNDLWVDPKNYEGGWWISHSVPEEGLRPDTYECHYDAGIATTDPQAVPATRESNQKRLYRLVVGIEYQVSVGACGFVFSLNKDGVPTAINGVSGKYQAGEFVFRSTRVSIDPEEYMGAWTVHGVTNPAPAGKSTVTLVPGVTYLYSFALPSSIVTFDLINACDVEPSKLSVEYGSATYPISIEVPFPSWSCREHWIPFVVIAAGLLIL